MAQLVMTIDSDSEIEQKVKDKKQPKIAKQKEAQDEEILLSHNVILQDHEPRQ